ncbi:Isoflavone reductase-like protein 4 isoform 1 [Hibiscus syriacus]|uniref:Isoflavone reductase-like protein 4 isoform 1 n=1 Tax=Hibiscus syriacus TaxID=106335 RepID=A0A6A2XQG6_HIBSY|nr:Isoflavone reductase-like protein 4 isoform 1 [Hibiscus syriacus]
MNLSRSSRASLRHSSTSMKQRRSGYEPSDTETEWQEHDQKKRTFILVEADKMVSNLPRNISPLKLSRRNTSKAEYNNGSPPRISPLPRRHSSKSPYKTRTAKSRNASPLSKSKRENWRHVSPYNHGREEHKLINEMGNGEVAGLYSKQSCRIPTKDEIGTIVQLLEDGRGSENSNYSRRSVTAPPRQNEEWRKLSPISRNMVCKQTEASLVKQQTVGEMNEMIANAKISRSPMYNASMFESTESISPGDIFFSREVGTLEMQMQTNKSPINGSFGNHVLPKPPMFEHKDSASHQQMRANGNVKLNAQGFSSNAGLSRTTMTSTSAANRHSNGKLSTESSKISYSSGRSSCVNSMKFTANRLKGQSETWFACVMRGPCRTSMKSPEKQDFDEASFIGKAIVVEKLRPFWADKYQPASLNGFTCHKQEAQLLKQLASHESCPNILFKGPSGSGRRALTMAFLREIYGDPCWNEKRPMQVLVPLASSAHHFELNVNLETKAKYALMGLVKEISAGYAITPEISTASFKSNYKVIVLYDADKAPENIHHLIKWIMDCHSDSCKFILCCEDDTDILESVTKSCKVIKVDAPVTHEIMEVLVQIARKEEFDLSMDFVAKIAAKSKQNLRKAIMALEACKAHNYPFADGQPIPLGWEDVLIELASEILADPSRKRLFISRGKLQKLLMDFVHPKLILQKLVEQFLKQVEAGLKRELYYWHAYYDKRLPTGTTALLKLEGY